MASAWSVSGVARSVMPSSAVNAGEHREQLALHRRLARQLTLYAPCPFVEHLAQRDVPAGGLSGIGPLKNADQEGLHRLGLLRLERLGARLPRGRREAAEEREHERHGHRDADAVPPDELAGTIAASLGPRRDRPALEEPVQVLGQRTGADVAALRLRAQRLEHDGIEVARHVRRRAREAPRLSRGRSRRSMRCHREGGA